MTSYWYCTNGIKQCILPNHHVPALDNAFQTHIRIQIEEAIFGSQGIAIADPSQGTLTLNGLHFGLYRQPPIKQSTCFESLVFIDDSETIHSDYMDLETNTGLSDHFTWMFQKEQSSNTIDSHCTCCIIS